MAGMPHPARRHADRNQTGINHAAESTGYPTVTKTWGVRGIDGPIRAAVEVLVEPVTGSKEMPANMAALKQNMEAAELS
jgi:hypothetical protein